MTIVCTIFVEVLAAETKSESSGVEEVAEAKETTGELAPETGSNEVTEPKQENVEESNGSQRTFSYEQLKTKSGNDVAGIDLKRREVSRFLLIFYVVLILVWNTRSLPEIFNDKYNKPTERASLIAFHFDEDILFSFNFMRRLK